MDTSQTFLDFEKEVSSNKIKPVYFIAACDNYFVKKGSEMLKKNIFGKDESNDSFFLKYADDSKYDELLDLCKNFASLFSSKKLIVVKRCEKFSRNLKFILEYASAPDPDTILMLVFDRDYVNESKLWTECSFYNFSELPEDYFLSWIKSEFTSRGCAINDRDVNLFIASVPYNFDIIVREIEKISNYVDIEDNKEKIVTREIILRSIGFSQTHTPEDLVISILDKDFKRCTDITHYLLNKSGISEIYLLSIILNYYTDLLCFKTQGVSSMNSFEIYSKYKVWRERAQFARTYSNKLKVSQFKAVFKNLLDTDKKLKTSMIDPKILITSMIEDLINS